MNGAHGNILNLRESNIKGMNNEERLAEIISKDVKIWPVEPHLYSVYPSGAMPGSYDSFGASTIYDVVACNRFYNWVMWGYSVTDYYTLCENVLHSSSSSWVLDIACGSLAFTAKLYATYSKRPVILLDQSLNLLRKAKSRLIKLCGKVPDNMVLIHADALQLPFVSAIFGTIISLNLLHCLKDVKTALMEMKRVLTSDGTAVLTTLVISATRWSDKYLNSLAGSGLLVPRNADNLLNEFNDMDMPVKLQIKGNLAFIIYN
jgi:SAM-dependent methyltransferase